MLGGTLLLQASTSMTELTSLGAAGVMGAMWLWERHTSRQREQQIDEAHARIMTDRVQLDQLIRVVQDNAQAMSRLSATQAQLVSEIRTRAVVQPARRHRPAPGVSFEGFDQETP